MANVSKTAQIGAAASEVWRTVSDFGAAARYIPVVSRCDVEGGGVGAVRTLTLQDGGRVIERLESVDEEERALRYTIVDSPLPIEGYVSTLRVQEVEGAAADRCEVEWSCTFEAKGAPESEVKKIFEGLYSAGLDGLRKLHER